MTSVTTWLRCEPHSRSADLAVSLEMRLADPLWLLGRQWQFGEFQGEDAGAPVWASWSGSMMPLALFLPGHVDGHVATAVEPYAAERPLECVVERESVRASEAMRANRRLAVEAGRHFMRLLPSALDQTYRATLQQTCGLLRLSSGERDSIDGSSLSFLDLVAGRALDGVRLLDATQARSPNDAAVALGFASADVAQAADAVRAWLQWVEASIGPFDAPVSACNSWDPARLEYAFALSAPADAQGAQHVLEASEYDGGVLDWQSVDVRPGKLARDTQTKPAELIGATVPTGLTFRGMPSRRLWEFEDAQVNFGGVSAAATDLTRLLFVEFLLQYGNDFFVLPIELAYGALYRINQLEITNTFADKTVLMPFADKDWQLFTLSDSGPGANATTSPMLFLPPVTAQNILGAPPERLHVLRDEMANISWAVEQVVESATGAPLNRHEAYQARRQKAADKPSSPTPGRLAYRLDTWATSLPDYWFPLIPSLERPGVLSLSDADPSTQQGRLLAELVAAAHGRLYDEEVPRAGVVIERKWQYSRWYQGSIHAWIAREKRTGRGEGTSGLVSDVVQQT